MSYTGNAPATQYTSTVKDTFNGDGSTTDFTLSRPSLVNNLEVFVENVQQEPTTAYTVSGTTLSFTSAPVSGTGNIYVIHRGQAVQTVVPPAGISLNATDATITNGLTVDKDGATVATFDRGTSDGTIVDLQKDGSSVGSIGTSTSYSGQMAINSSSSNLIINANGSDYAFDSTQFYPLTAGRNLGLSGNEFGDLRLSGGVYLGGTGAANYLDDYEEGTWTATVNQGSVTSTGGIYVKVGKMVHVKVKLTNFTDRSDPGYLSIGGLPFARQDDNQVASSGIVYRYISGNALTGVYFQGSNEIVFYKHTNGNWDTLSNDELNSAGSEIYFALTYYTGS